MLPLQKTKRNKNKAAKPRRRRRACSPHCSLNHLDRHTGLTRAECPWKQAPALPSRQADSPVPSFAWSPSRGADPAPGHTFCLAGDGISWGHAEPESELLPASHCTFYMSGLPWRCAGTRSERRLVTEPWARGTPRAIPRVRLPQVRAILSHSTTLPPLLHQPAENQFSSL